MNAQSLIDELEQGLGIITSLANGLSDAEAAARPAPEAWSMLEVLCHLYDEEREDFRQRLDILLHRPADPWPPIRPAEWVSERNYASRNFGEVLAGWRAERQKSLEWLNRLQNPTWDQESASPWGGTLKAGDMLASWAAHDGLHIRQMVEIRRARVEQLAQPYAVGYAGDW